MSEVALSIGGRSYKVACAPGEEDHVSRLGAAIDAKLRTMPQLGAQDAQNLLFAALLLADDLHESRNADTAALDEAAQAREGAEQHKAREARLREELEALAQERDALRGELDQAHGTPASALAFDDSDLAPALERFADLLETCADKLEGKARSA